MFWLKVQIIPCRYTVPQTTFSIPVTVNCEELSSLINSILRQGNRENTIFCVNVTYPLYFKYFFYSYIYFAYLFFLLFKENILPDEKQVDFDFLIDGHFITDTLQNHISFQNLSTVSCYCKTSLFQKFALISLLFIPS